MKPLEFCQLYKPCSEGRDFAMAHETMSEVWDNCKRPDWLFWILQQHKPLEKEQSVRLAIAFAETCLHHVIESEPRPKAAIDAAKAWLEDPTEENCAAAYAAADAAADAADAAAYAAAYAAADAAYAAAYAAADAARAAADAAAYAAAYAAQCDFIRSVITNPFLP